MSSRLRSDMLINWLSPPEGSRFMCLVRCFSSTRSDSGETSRTEGSSSRNVNVGFVGVTTPLSRLETTRDWPAGRGNWSGEEEKVLSVKVGVDLPDRRVEGMVEEGVGDCDEEGAAPDIAVAKVDDKSKRTISNEWTKRFGYAVEG